MASTSGLGFAGTGCAVGARQEDVRAPKHYSAVGQPAEQFSACFVSEHFPHFKDASVAKEMGTAVWRCIEASAEKIGTRKDHHAQGLKHLIGQAFAELVHDENLINGAQSFYRVFLQTGHSADLIVGHAFRAPATDPTKEPASIFAEKTDQAEAFISSHITANCYLKRACEYVGMYRRDISGKMAEFDSESVGYRTRAFPVLESTSDNLRLMIDADLLPATDAFKANLDVLEKIAIASKSLAAVAREFGHVFGTWDWMLSTRQYQANAANSPAAGSALAEVKKNRIAEFNDIAAAMYRAVADIAKNPHVTDHAELARSLEKRVQSFRESHYDQVRELQIATRASTQPDAAKAEPK